MMPEHEARDLTSAIDCLYEAAGCALSSLHGSQASGLGYYESSCEALLLHVLVVRHTEAFCGVAREGFECLPSAQVLARAAFEVAVRCLWMLAPSDPFAREARWLALLEEWEQDSEKLARAGAAPPGLTTTEIRRFRSSVEQLLAGRGYSKPRGRRSAAPTFHAMLTDLSRVQDYANYMRLSKPVHGTLGATAMYRRGLGNAKVFVEDIDPRRWRDEIAFVWRNLDVVTGRIAAVLQEINVLPAEHPPFASVEFRRRFEDLLGPRRVFRARTVRRLTAGRS